ncbi:MAG TPA: sensor domain-containing phosphodiesterase [Rugosimonospora sp.]|nr:sensor domain-containing phosphodiesterase [Rugosimonospora sp.]
MITIPLGVIAAVLLIPTVAANPAWASWQETLLFFGLLLAADWRSMRVEVRRHTIGINLLEIPFLLGLVFLPPLTLVVIRLAVAAIGQVRLRASPVKSCFNIVNVAAGTSLAAMIVTLLAPDDPRHNPLMWLVVFAALSASVVTMIGSLLAVLTLVQGGLTVQKALTTAVPGLIVGETSAVIGLIVLVAVEASPWSVILFAVLFVVLIWLYRWYADLMRQHKSLVEIYDITRVVADTRHDGTLADVLLGRVRELLHAESATLWLPAQDGRPETLLTARADDPGLLDLSSTPEALRRTAVRTGQTVAVGPRTGDEGLRHQLQQQGVKDAIVVPLRSGAATVGSLEVTGHLGEDSQFGPDDVRLLETVAAHVAVAVENGRLVERLRFDADHDQLTRLPNRRRMLASLDEAVKINAPGEVVALIEFDVAGLRDVNETLGHGEGDKLLAEVAKRLVTLAPSGALVARVGGGEFAIQLRMASADAAIELATGLRTALQGPMPMGSFTLDIDTSVGIALHPDHGSSPATLLQRADVATFAAKSTSSAVQLFNLGLESRSARRLGLAGDLRRALENGELEVVFQPKVSLASRDLVGVECLARWEHPAHGSVAPEDFVAVAGHTGQLGRVTELVLREGLRRAKEWADQARPLNVAVNLSPRTLVAPEFVDRVAALLDEYGVPAGQLTLEITEDGMLGETDRPLPTLRALKDLGVRLSVDDFGTGYSSLSYLRRLPVHEVKIDRTFVQGMATDAGDLAIVRAIVDLARHFGLTAVAEGVESEMTLGLLEEMGCDVGQGFLFSRPLSFDRLEAWFAAQTEPEPTPMGVVRRLRAVAN